MRSPPPTLSRRQERELRAAVARRERSAGPVVIEVRVEEGDTLESLARKTGLPAERIAAVAAEAAAGRGNGSVRGKGKGNAKGKEGKDEGEQQQQQLLVPGTALEFESPFEITPEVTAAVLRLEEIARSENLTREMADRQRDELVAALRERDRELGAQAAQAAALGGPRGGGGGAPRGGGRLGLGTALDVLLLVAAVSAAVVAAAASMGVVAALQKRSAERRAAREDAKAAAARAAAAAGGAGEEERGEQQGASGGRPRDWKQVVAETGRAAAEAAAAAVAAEVAIAAAAAGGQPAVPAWVLGKAVWRVRMASGVAEAAVPLPRRRGAGGPSTPTSSSSSSSPSSSSSSSPPAPPPPDLVWLAFEEEEDAEAWSRWLTAPGGPLSEGPPPSSSSGARSPQKGLPLASVVRAAPEQLHGAAKEAGRALAFVPGGGAFRPLPRPGEPQRLVLARLARAAHPQRCGVDLLGAAARAAAVAGAARVWSPTSGSGAAVVAEEYERTMARLEREAKEGKGEAAAEEAAAAAAAEEGGGGATEVEVEVEREEEAPRAAATAPAPSPPTPPPAPTPAPAPEGESTTAAAADETAHEPEPEAAAPQPPREAPSSRISVADLDRLRAAARGETEAQRRIRAGEPVASLFADEEEVADAVPASAAAPPAAGGAGEAELVDPLARNQGARASPEPTFDAVVVGHVGERFWYQNSPTAKTFAVPIMGVGRGERSLLEIHGVLPADFDAGFDDEDGGGGGVDGGGDGVRREGPKVFIVFEDPQDAERCAFIWHCSGLAASARADVQGVVKMRAGELDAEALYRRTVPLVFKKGSLRLKPDTPADALLTAFAAGATEQLVLSLPPPPPPTPPKEKEREEGEKVQAEAAKE